MTLPDKFFWGLENSENKLKAWASWYTVLIYSWYIVDMISSRTNVDSSTQVYVQTNVRKFLDPLLFWVKTSKSSRVKH